MASEEEEQDFSGDVNPEMVHDRYLSGSVSPTSETGVLASNCQVRLLSFGLLAVSADLL